MQIGTTLWGRVLVSHWNQAIRALLSRFCHISTSRLRERQKSNRVASNQVLFVPCHFTIDSNPFSYSVLLMFPLHLFFIRFISPCRSLCESVRDSCAPIMSCYGYPWPEILRCDQYPADHLMCISSITNTSVQTGGRRGKKWITRTHIIELT